MKCSHRVLVTDFQQRDQVRKQPFLKIVWLALTFIAYEAIRRVKTHFVTPKVGYTSHVLCLSVIKCS